MTSAVILVAKNGKVGSCLKSILSSIGINPKPGCPCLEIMAEMDEIGIDACKLRRIEFIDKLRTGSTEYRWTEKLKAAAIATANGLAFKLNFLDPFPGMFSEAIRLSEQQYLGPF